MKKTLLSTLTFALLTVSAHAYDDTKAKELNTFYAYPCYFCGYSG